MTPYRWTITFESDWGVGSGRGGPGALDQTVRLDRDGLPYLPGKTATGLWRDAIELVMTALSGGEDRDPRAGWVAALLGSETHDPPERNRTPREVPRPAVLAIRDAHIRQPLARELVAGGLTAALRGVVPGVKVDRARGTAEPGMLRFVERARVGLTLHSEIEVDTAGWSERQVRYAEAVLVVAASQLRHAGGDRRRGAGRCTVRLPDAMPLADAAAVLRTVVDHPVATPPASSMRPAVGDGSVRLALTITCRLPVVVTARTLGNIRRSFDHLPGTMLLAAAAGRLRRAGLDADAAIRDGRLLASDATPEVIGERGLPAPRCLAIPKGSPAGPVTAVNLLRVRAAGVVAMRGGYVAPVDSGAAFVRRVERETLTHNVIDDAVQRPTGRVGGVYSYETMPPGSVLRGEVRVPAGWEAAAVAALAGRWRIGRASKDEYGLVDVTVHIGAAEPTVPAAVPPGGSAAVPPGGELVIWLVSTALVRDRWLEPVTDACSLRAVLEEVLGGVALADPAGGAAWVDRRESWHTAWGLPRTSLVGLGAGTVLRWVAPRGVPGEALARLAADGIGERRAEGFGRVVVNPPLLAEPRVELVPADRPTVAVRHTDGELTGEETQLVQRLGRAAAMAEIDRRAAAANPFQVLTGSDKKKQVGVSRAQLGVIRERAERATRPEQLAAIPGYLRQAAARHDAWRAAPGVEKALERLFTDREHVWRLLGFADEEAAGWRDDVFVYAVRRTLATALSRLRAQGSGEGS